MSQYTPMIEQYLSIKAEHEDAFLFFRLGDFYEMFFDDAILAAKELEITLTSRMGGKEDKIPMCGVPYHTSEPYINRLIEKGYKVAICEQVEDPKQAQGVVKREVTRVVTPGTLMEQNMLRESENNYILFLTCHRHYALVACDLSTGEVLGTELSELEWVANEVNQFMAREIIAAGLTKEDQEKANRLFDQHVTVREIDDAIENRWMDMIDISQTDQEISDEMRRTLQFMCQYVMETQKKTIGHFQPFQYYRPAQFLTIDVHSRRNLELTETIRERSRKGSLLWLLDETSTAMGGRLIRKWIQRPLMNQQHIEQRLDIVSTLIQHSYEHKELRQLLEQVYDLERLAGRVSYGNVNPKDLIQLKRSLHNIPDIIHILTGVSHGSLHHLLAQMDPCQDIVTLLEESIIEDPPLSITEGDIFKSGFHSELDRLREASQNGKRWIAELESTERTRTGIKSLKVGFNKVFGYYIEVTKANLHLLEEGRYERRQTLRNAERFVTPELKEKEALILEADEKLTDIEYHLFLELRDQVNQHTSRLQHLAQIIAQIDSLSSLAQVSERDHFVRPSFSNNGELYIKNGRHPVIEKVLDQSAFVANDLHMDQDSRQILLITGPNMSGKSTYMRQTAIMSIMAQMGCFVPADEAVFPIFDRVFTRIGAADDLASGQSTFMVEMLETQQALTQATADSLILLDEIGRGTSTYDGMSLAQAVAEYIHDHVQAKTLFSTHYHELTDLAEHLERLKNVHVACSEKDGRVTFLHKVREGKSDRSYGIHVAQLANMPETLIERANEILIELEKHQSATSQPEEDHFQLSLFENECQEKKFISQHRSVLNRIEELEVINMTPLEALNTLFQIQQELKSR